MAQGKPNFPTVVQTESNYGTSSYWLLHVHDYALLYNNLFRRGNKPRRQYNPQVAHLPINTHPQTTIDIVRRTW